MKKLLIITLIAMSVSAKTQSIFHAETGISSKKAIVLSLGFGWQYKGILAEGVITTLPFNQREPAFFGGVAGYEIKYNEWSLTPLVGMSYRMVSTDKKSLNGFVRTVGGRLMWNGAYVSYLGQDKTAFYSIGIKGNL